MRYIILTITFLFSLSSYSQDQIGKEDRFSKSSGSTGSIECEHDFEDLSFNLLPESFFGNVDRFYIDPFCYDNSSDYREDLSVSTFDGKYVVNFESYNDDLWIQNLKSSYYYVRNKDNLTLESFTPTDSIFILDKYYENGRLMLTGSLEKMQMRQKKTRLKNLVVFL